MEGVCNCGLYFLGAFFGFYDVAHIVAVSSFKCGPDRAF